MKYCFHVCLALIALLSIAACGTPEQPNIAAQPTLQQTVGLVSTVAPPREPATVASPTPTAPPISEASSQATTAEPVPPPNTLPQPCPEPPGDGASPVPAPNGQLGRPSIATTACPNIPAEQMPSSQSVVSGSTVASGGAGTGQIIVTGSTTVPNQAGTAANNTPTPLMGGRTIGLGDQQQALLLSVGDTFKLKLGSGIDWTIQIADAHIVARMPGETTDDSQGVYQALGRGATILTATGDPPCRKSQPACMMPSIAFTLNIVVR